jgi:abhydrolase domain-containing protein 6
MPVIDKVISDILKDRTTLEDHLHRIKAPTIVLWGENDRILDVSCMEQIEKKMQTAELVVVPDCGHTVHHTVPELCAAYINKLISSTMPSLPHSIDLTFA